MTLPNQTLYQNYDVNIPFYNQTLYQNYDVSIPFQNYFEKIDLNTSIDNIYEKLNDTGFVLFDQNFSKTDLLKLAQSLGKIFHHRDSESSGITNIKNEFNDETGYFGFSNKSLFLHTDRSCLKSPPTLAIIYCEKNGEIGGESLFSDGKEIYSYIKKNYSKELIELEKTHAATFLGDKVPFLSPIFKTRPDGYTVLRFRKDEQSLYSAKIIPFFPTFCEIIQDFSFSISLRPGQGYIVQNGRWLHGRNAFFGERSVYRILVIADERIPFGFKT